MIDALLTVAATLIAVLWARGVLNHPERYSGRNVEKPTALPSVPPPPRPRSRIMPCVTVRIQMPEGGAIPKQ